MLFDGKSEKDIIYRLNKAQRLGHLLVKDKIQVEGTLTRPLLVLFLSLGHTTESKEQNPQNKQSGEHILHRARHPLDLAAQKQSLPSKTTRFLHYPRHVSWNKQTNKQTRRTSRGKKKGMKHKRTLTDVESVFSSHWFPPKVHGCGAPPFTKMSTAVVRNALALCNQVTEEYMTIEQD